jgi:hypothetical protein
LRNAAGPLEVLADLRARQVIVSTRIDAPVKGTSKGRVSWLLRQLTEAPEDLSIEARLARSQSSLAPVRLLRESPGELYPEAGREIRQFVISATRNMGVKRDATQGSFIYSVVSTTKEFYRDVLQNLRAWKAPPPKLKEAKKEEPTDLEDLSPRVAEGIRAAEEEQKDEASAAPPDTEPDLGSR